MIFDQVLFFLSLSSSIKNKSQPLHKEILLCSKYFLILIHCDENKIQCRIIRQEIKHNSVLQLYNLSKHFSVVLVSVIEGKTENRQLEFRQYCQISKTA
jgi:hypothetical protein